MSPQARSSIYVIAGVNGAGKSSIAGAAFREAGDYYNPDEVARKLIAADPRLTLEEANSATWHVGVQLLKRAMEEHLDFAFETTLGANTIPRLLSQAAKLGCKLYVWYVGLASPELHISRVRARVLQGGHSIPKELIRSRYERSRLNLIALMPSITALRVFDNSEQVDLARGQEPKLRLVLHMLEGEILSPPDFKETPEWAKPIVAAALRKG